MTRVHRLKHVKRLLAPALTYKDAIGTHAKRVLHKFALANFAFALGVRRPSLHPPDMRKLQLQFGGVFDGDDSFLGRNVSRQGIQQGGFTGPRAARDDKRYPSLHGRPQQVCHPATKSPHLYEAIHRERPLGEFSD